MSTDKPPIERRLAAILAADIAGYSALMGEDEETTVSDLKGHQRVILPMVSDFGGRVIDTAGDGILAEYPSVLNAVRCAVEIQQTMAERNAGVTPARQMRFRIGVNLGDVVFDQNRIYGDGVNIAARLEALAPPGGICVSRAVREAVGNKLSVGFADLGEKRVKNIAKPVHTYEVNLHGGQTARYTEPPSSRLLSILAPLSVKALVAIAAGAAVAVMILAGIRLMERKSPALPVAAARPEVAKDTKKVDTLPPGPPHSRPPPQSPPFVPPEAGKPNLAPVVPASPPQQAAVPSPPPQQPAEVPSTAVAASFDGVWIATFTGGTNCALKSGTYQLTIYEGAVLESRPDTGRVNAAGAIEYTLRGAANLNVVVEHRGKLVGDSGRGAYKVRGGSCVGVTEFKRGTSVIAAPAAPSAEPARIVNQTPAQRESKGGTLQGFDGPWHVISTGGTHCPVKSFAWQLVIENGLIIASRPEPGRVEPDGTFRFTLPARVGPNTIVRYHGKLSGDSGRGNYTGGGGCVGTIELKRLPRQQ